MKTIMKTGKYLSLVLSLLLPLSAGAGKTSPAILSPEEVVLDFYRLNLQDPPSDGYTKSQDLYVSPSLQVSINDSLSCNFDGPDTDQAFCDQPRPCKETAHNVVCLWGDYWVENDVNYYTKSQDYPDSWITERAAHTESQSADTATVRITLGKAPEPLRSFRVKLILTGGQWKIDNIVMME